MRHPCLEKSGGDFHTILLHPIELKNPFFVGVTHDSPLGQLGPIRRVIARQGIRRFTIGFATLVTGTLRFHFAFHGIPFQFAELISRIVVLDDAVGLVHDLFVHHPSKRFANFWVMI